MAANQSNGGCKTKNVKVNEWSTTPDALTIVEKMYYLNKGETIAFQGRKNFTHSTMIQCFVDKLEGNLDNVTLIDRGDILAYVITICEFLKVLNNLWMSVGSVAIATINCELLPHTLSMELIRVIPLLYFIRQQYLVWAKYRVMPSNGTALDS